MKKEDPGSSSASGLNPVRKIGLIYNLRRATARGEADDRYEEYDCIETIESLKGNIESFGFEVLLFEQGEGFAEALRKARPDFVVNIAEGCGIRRARESQVPALLEMMDIPYAGSDAVTLALALDKWLAHHMLAAAGLSVPTLFMFSREQELRNADHIFTLHREYLVKPRWEGSSKGVFHDSVVTTHTELVDRVRRIWKRYSQPALVEEFLPGQEITVGVLGNRPPRVVGLMAVSPEPTGGRSFYTIGHKREWETRVRYNPPSSVDKKTRIAVSRDAVRCFRFLEIKDIARIDFKADRHGVPKIIDINPLPGLSESYSDLPILYRLSGGEYKNLLRGFLREAFMRQGLLWPEAVEAEARHAL
jgi:D-alanine-D-alanine ligase